ncbi:MAG: MurR/RpiR family transcriptional regulator, partial [Lactobacillaceae bacterium]
MDLINKITNNYSNFKGSSKKIADYLLKNSNTFLNLDAQHLGTETGTSSASIIRFCQQMGFKGLKDFKIVLAKGVSKNE